LDQERIIEKMMDFGLNKYEAKAYVALIKNPEVTAYELSKDSGVPQAKIYETMSKLLSKNLVNIIGYSPTKYIPVDFDAFLDTYKENVEYSVDYLKKNIKNLSQSQKVSYLWHLEGRDNIFQKIKNMIPKANSFLYLEAWAEEFDFFADELKEVESKGIEIVSVIYGDTKNDIGIMHFHEMEGLEKQVEEVGRWFTLVVDGAESLFAVFVEKGIDQGIWTENKAFMLMAESFISHDIFIAEIYKMHKLELDKEFGPNMQHIRKYVKTK